MCLLFSRRIFDGVYCSLFCFQSFGLFIFVLFHYFICISQQTDRGSDVSFALANEQVEVVTLLVLIDCRVNTNNTSGMKVKLLLNNLNGDSRCVWR